MLPIVHHPDYQAEIPEGHRFPMGKFRRLAEVLVEEGLVPAWGFRLPEPARADELSLAHDDAWVEQVLTGTAPPRIARDIGFPMVESVVRRARAATGGTILAARLALEHGVALNTAGGSHHARRKQGAGFCVFNDVAVAASVLLAERLVERVLVVDLDVHQGDGTADIFAGDPRVTTVSVHAEWNYPHRKVPSTFDLGLPDETGDSDYLAALDDLIAAVISASKADIVFYNAGVDPHTDDRLGRLALTDAGLAERDARVISAVRRSGRPLVGVIGGGYDPDIDRLARRHATLHRTTAEIFG